MDRAVMLNLAAYTTLSLYEENFAKLMLLLDGLEHIHDSASLEAQGLPRVTLAVLEKSVYTTTITLSQSFGFDEEFLRPQYMKIRIYHDAQVAEVLGYQHAVQFRTFYPYPNPKMYQPYEKRRVNQFLGEWLHYCLDNGYRLLVPNAPSMTSHRSN